MFSNNNLTRRYSFTINCLGGWNGLLTGVWISDSWGIFRCYWSCYRIQVFMSQLSLKLCMQWWIQDFADGAGEGAIPKWGINLLFWPFFPENLTKFKEIRRADREPQPHEPFCQTVKWEEVRGFGWSLWLMSLQDGVVGGEALQFPWSRVHWCRENGTLTFGCEIKLFLIWTW